MKKIVIASDTYLPKIDGVTIFFKNVIPKLSKNFSIIMIVPAYKKRIPEIDNIKLIKNKVSRILKIASYSHPWPRLLAIKKAVKNCDLVWVHSIGPLGKSTLRYAKKYNKKAIASIHAIESQRFALCSEITSRLRLFINSLARAYERNFYNRCDLIIVSSKSVLKIVRNYGIKTKAAIIPPGIDKRFVPKNKDACKSLLKIPSETFVIGYVGRISNEKNLKLLKDVFDDLPIEKKLLLIVGQGSYWQRRALKDSKNVRITGWVNYVEDYLNAMDVYVLPSFTETSSLSTLEAMACGLPVVVTPVGAIREYVKNGYNGFLFKPNDKEALFKILMKLYKNPGLRKKLGRNARKSVQKFSWDLTVKKLFNVLNEF